MLLISLPSVPLITAGARGALASELQAVHGIPCILVELMMHTAAHLTGFSTHSSPAFFSTAGGRGALTFELQAVHGIPCTLVEPRPLKLSKQQHLFLKEQAEREAGGLAQGKEGLEGQGLAIQGGAAGPRGAAAPAGEGKGDPSPGADAGVQGEGHRRKGGEGGLFDAGGLFEVLERRRQPGAVFRASVEQMDGQGDGGESEGEDDVEGEGKAERNGEAEGGDEAEGGGEAAKAGEAQWERGGESAQAAPALGGHMLASLHLHHGRFWQLQAHFMPDLWSSGMREGGAGSQAVTAGVPEGSAGSLEGAPGKLEGVAHKLEGTAGAPEVGAGSQEGAYEVLQLLRSCSVVSVRALGMTEGSARFKGEGRGRCNLGP